MKATYRFPEAPELAGLSVTAEARGRLVTLRPRGRGALRFVPYLTAYSAWLTAAGPIEAGDDSHPGLYSLYLPPLPSEPHRRQILGDLRTLVLHDPSPLALTLGVTDRCQCTCGHCSAVRRDGEAVPLSGDELHRVIAQALDDLNVDVITFTGGEPLLRDDLEDLVACVPTEKAITLVFTNGLLLDPGRARSLAAAGLFGVHLSLDSPDPVEHDRLRGHDGCFAAVEQAAKAATGAGLKVGISTYISRHTARSDRLERIAALAASWGAVEVTVFDAIATGRLFEHPEIHMSPEDHRAVVAQGKRISRRYGNRPRVVTQSWTNDPHSFGRLIGCLAATLQVHVTAHGELAPCDFTPLSFGNVREAPLDELWRRLVAHPEWSRRRLKCRMQDPAFRTRYIDTIPAGAPLPCPITALDDEPGAEREPLS